MKRIGRRLSEIRNRSAIMFVRVSLFAMFGLLTFWLFANVLQVASGRGLTMAFWATGYASAASQLEPAGVLASQVATSLAKHREDSKSGADTEADAARGKQGATGEGGAKDAPVKDATGLVVPRDIAMLSTLFALCGALGATLHAMGSLVAFAGNGKFADSWALWYLAQPVRGAVLATGFFWLLQGGLLGGLSRNDAQVATMAMMGATFLVGLFSDPAIEKLREVFQVLFRTSDKGRQNPLVAARSPVIRTVTVDPADRSKVHIEGADFADTDEVVVDAAIYVPLRASRTATQLDITLAAPPAAGTSLRFAVMRLAPNPGVSDVLTKVV